MDDAKKKAGPPQSLSRKEEKANKRNTKKKRRQQDKKFHLTEKAVSRAQQRFMGMVAAGKIDPPKGLSKKEARKFAKTKHKGLPEKVAEGISSFKNFLALIG